MKGTLGQLSSETQQAFQVMQKELVAMDNLLTKCETQLSMTSDISDKIQKMAQTSS